MDDERLAEVKASARLLMGVREGEEAPSVDAAIEKAVSLGFKTRNGIARVASYELWLVNDWTR